MTPDELATCYVPLPLAWRYVVAGDVFVGKGGKLWTVLGAVPGVHFGVEVQNGANTFKATVDPDAQVQVLTPVHAHDAMALTREELGGRLIAARSGTEGAAA